MKAAAPGAIVKAVRDQAAAMEIAPEAEVVVGSGRLFSRALVEAAPRLRWVQSTSAGVEHFCPHLTGTDVVLTNARGAHPIPIAEHFLAMLLSLAHRIPEFSAFKAQKHWQRLEFTEVRGMTVLVLGLGNLGREIVAAAHGIGLRVLGYDPYLAVPAATVERLYKADELHEALGNAQIVVSALPLTPETRNFMGAAEFGAMPENSYFFSLSRGGVVDEPALVSALQSGRLAGAGLDVFQVEPLPAESPLWGMPNVIITPHVAAATKNTEARVEAILLENLSRYVLGRPLLNEVGVRRGF
jgi:phosphoglycerate dehydrogenase-like enzyme